jgi:hypothetical protein
VRDERSRITDQAGRASKPARMRKKRVGHIPDPEKNAENAFYEAVFRLFAAKPPVLPPRDPGILLTKSFADDDAKTTVSEPFDNIPP